MPSIDTEPAAGTGAAPPPPPEDIDDTSGGEGDGAGDDGAEDEDGGTAGRVAAPPSRLPRVLLAVGAVVALLLLGATAGLLIQLSSGGGSSTAVPAVDSVDVGFCQDMTVHHRQAVLMAGLAVEKAASPEVHQLAFDIQSTQTEQIGRMQGWLALWGRASLPLGSYMSWMGGATGADMMAGMHGTAVPATGVSQMPGMAGQDELNQLRTLTGTEFDVRFLQLMLRHHQGAVGMLSYAAQHSQIDAVRNLAAQALSAQQREASYMQQLLAQRGAAPLPFN